MLRDYGREYFLDPYRGIHSVPGTLLLDLPLDLNLPQILPSEHILISLDLLLGLAQLLAEFQLDLLGIRYQCVYSAAELADQPVFLFEPALILFLHFLQAQGHITLVLFLFLEQALHYHAQLILNEDHQRLEVAGRRGGGAELERVLN